MEVMGVIDENLREKQRENRRTYGRANFAELRSFFNEVNWDELEELAEVQQKYDFFRQVYEMGVKKYVRTYKIKEKRKKIFV